MKNKILKSSILIAILGIVTWSCNKDQIAPSEISVENNTELFRSFENYNTNFLATHTNPNRGFWSTLGYITQIAAADLIGAGAGVTAAAQLITYAGVATGGTGAIVAGGVAGIIGAGGASYAASGNPPSGGGSNYTDDVSLNLNLPVNYSFYNSCGSIHNSYLKSVFYGGQTQTEWVNSNFPNESDALINILSNE